MPIGMPTASDLHAVALRFHVRRRLLIRLAPPKGHHSTMPLVVPDAPTLYRNKHVVIDSLHGPLILDLDGIRLYRGDKEVALTITEFFILRALAEQAGTAVEQRHLLRAASGSRHPLGRRNLPPHVRRLRTKIEVDPSQPAVLKTVRGYGYRLDVR